jgi:hypothetical protein
MITESEAYLIFRLVVTLKRLDLFYEHQDKEFWDLLEDKLSRFGLINEEAFYDKGRQK